MAKQGLNKTARGGIALNRKTRRTVTALASRKTGKILAVVNAPAAPERQITKLKMEPSSLRITDNGLAFAIGKDGRLYGWNAFLGGWVLNIMTDQDKQQLAKHVVDKLNEKAIYDPKGHAPTHTKSAEAQAAEDVMS